MNLDPVEFGRMMGRLDAQDKQIAELRLDVKHLVDMANQGKGGLLMLTTIGSIVGAIVGWVASHLFHG